MRKSLTVILAVVFIVSSALFVYRTVDANKADDILQEAYDLAQPKSPLQSEPVQQEEAIITEDPTPLAEAPAVTEAPQEEPEVQTTASDTPVEEAKSPAATEPLPEEIPVIDENALPKEAEILINTDLDALKAVNPDVFGWIYIPNGDVSHPLVHSRDNSEYLSHAWNGEKSSSGAIFMERRSSEDFSDFNTIIYGHNMRNNKFFGPLHEYKNKEYRDANPYIYILVEGRILQYEVFSSYKSYLDGHTYRLVFETEGTKSRAIEDYIARSRWDTDVEVDTQDKILTLSTCTKAGDADRRWVVQAVLVGEWEI